MNTDQTVSTPSHTHTMTRYRGFVRGKTRIFLAWIFAFVIGFSSRRYPALPGVFVCFLGATLRFWASGYLRKDTRPAVGGPYSFVRNPLYLGTYLMALGVIWSIGTLWLLAACTFMFAAIYHYVILDEETKLRDIFGASYEAYCRAVPRFFPRLLPPCWPASRRRLLEVNPAPEQHRFSWNLAMRNRAYEAYASFAGLVALASITAFCWQKFV